MICNCGFQASNKNGFVLMERMNEDMPLQSWSKKTHDVVSCPNCGTLMLWMEKQGEKLANDIPY